MYRAWCFESDYDYYLLISVFGLPIVQVEDIVLAAKRACYKAEAKAAAA